MNDDQKSEWRTVPVDGARLFFHRQTGTNVLCEGDETAHLALEAPRAIQFGITNVCNMACSFCSRDVRAASDWTASEVVVVLAALADAGVLEVAFGGGEPWAFPGFSDLVRRLYDETPLAISMTTNGTLLTKAVSGNNGLAGEHRLSVARWPRDAGAVDRGSRAPKDP